MCFRCCDSTTHRSRDCKVSIQCRECGSKRHTTALHVTKQSTPSEWRLPERNNGGETTPVPKNGGEPTKSISGTSANQMVKSTCTEICGDGYSGKSCAKILPVDVFHEDNEDNIVRMYAIIDDQSNRSLASSLFFDSFNIQDKPEVYTLSTCSGKVSTSGRRAEGFVARSVQGDVSLKLPIILECDYIPNHREEIPTPEDAKHHPHLAKLMGKIEPLNDECHIMLLIGRDLIEAHQARDQILGPPGAPYALQLQLGWVIIGETCLDKQHLSKNITVRKTYFLPSGQPTLLKPCENKFEVREQYYDPIIQPL